MFTVYYDIDNREYRIVRSCDITQIITNAEDLHQVTIKTETDVINEVPIKSIRSFKYLEDALNHVTKEYLENVSTNHDLGGYSFKGGSAS